MISSNYLIWEKIGISENAAIKKLIGFVYEGEDLSVPDLTLYSQWNEEQERVLQYVEYSEVVGYQEEEMELPWAEEKTTALSPVQSKNIKEFWNEEEAVNYVYKTLSKLNNISEVKNTVELIKESPFVYSQSSNVITITLKPGKVLVYDSDLEKITVFPSPITGKEGENIKIINWYLQRR
jgi:hypothetical protein